MKRSEKKYILTYREYIDLKDIISRILPRDPFDKGNGYLVHSTYYDTDDFLLARNKINGEALSLRLRKRQYEKSDVFIESKSEINGNKYKIREKYSEESNFKNNFLKSIHSSLPLSPKLDISYRREVFEAKIPGYLRINFDTEINSSYSATHPIIMEIKTEISDLPLFLINILNRYNLKNTKYSKYVNSITGLEL